MFLPPEPGWSSKGGSLMRPRRELVSRLNLNFHLRDALICIGFLLLTSGCELSAAAQATEPASTHRTGRAAHPSNAQLANPDIEARVDRLLRQMTLEEKIGQLVQDNDTGDEPPDEGAQAAA